MKTITIQKVQTGIFQSFVDGVKTDWEIVNGCMGASGRGQNIYCMYNTKSGKFIPIGSLQGAKKSLFYTQ